MADCEEAGYIGGECTAGAAELVLVVNLISSFAGWFGARRYIDCGPTVPVFELLLELRHDTLVQLAVPKVGEERLGNMDANNCLVKAFACVSIEESFSGSCCC
jgi:hypothetical protein